MNIFYYSRSVSEFSNRQNKTIGLVPTMGALHAGHLELVKQALTLCDIIVVTIFVNPLQFNNPEDLIKYPKSIQEDLEMLNLAGANVVFVPTNDEVYAKSESIELDISPLNDVFEGLHRPGHFNGVVNVLVRLFELIRPSDVFFGLKDLQQCLVAEKLIGARFPDIQQHNCPTLRETSGLAMSSRNKRLSEAGKLKAASIYSALNNIKNTAGEIASQLAGSKDFLSKNEIETEYLELIELPDMNTLNSNEPGKRKAVVFAGYLEGVRLIDNIVF